MKSQILLIALLGAACAPPSAPMARSTASHVPPSSARAMAVPVCRASSLPMPALSAIVTEAAQAHRGNGARFLQAAPPSTRTWFDLLDLERPLDLPAGATPVAVTRTTIWIVLENGDLALVPQGQGGMTTLPLKLWPTDVVESGARERWALARTSAARTVDNNLDRADEAWLLHIAENGTHDVRSLGPAAPRAMRLALDADGRPTLVVARSAGARLSLQVSRSLDPGDVVEVDSVTVGERLAEHSDRTGIELAAAVEGPQNIAIAWRPLIAAAGGAEAAGVVPETAEVRWLAVTPAGAAGTVSTHRGAVRQLGGTTGVGPYPPAPIHLRAYSVADGALFVWLDDEIVVGARTGARGGAPLAPRDGAGWLGASLDGPEPTLALVRGAPLRVSRFRIACE